MEPKPVVPGGKTEGVHPVWLSIGYALLGANVGFLAGVSTAAVTTTLMAALFALVAGGVMPVLKEINAGDRGRFGQALAAFSCACLVFLIFGIAVKENRWLSTARATPGKEEPYLKGLTSSDVDRLDALCRNQQYDALRKALQERVQ